MDVKAYAKINLGLDVLSRRPDGYHEVCMVMQQLELYDEICLGRSREEASCLKLETTSAEPEGRDQQDKDLTKYCDYSDDDRKEDIYLKLFGESPDVPSDKRNLMYKAALLMKESFGIGEPIYISCRKHIPSQAGLAGGSADAAAVLKGINELFSIGASERELCELGLKLGADVPYCVLGGTALSEGIGEVLTPLKPAPDLHVLLAKPMEGVSTKDIYTELDASGLMSPGEESSGRKSLMQLLLKGIETSDRELMCSGMFNLLSEVTKKKLPYIRELEERMKQAGASASLMSGSGPTVYGLFEDTKRLEAAYEALCPELSSGRLSHLIKTKFKTKA